MKSEKTREVIALSSYQLLQDHDFEDITVDMICQQAGISRSTFYRFFKDKFDVLIGIFCIQYDHIEAKYPEAKDCRRLLYEYAKLLDEYRDFYYAALNVSGQNSLRDHIYHRGLQYYIRQIEAQRGEPVPEHLRIQAIFFTDGITALYTKWLQKKIRVTPQQLVDIAFQCMPVEMARYFL